MALRALVAGVGNALKGDDGFGVAAAAALARDPALPAGAVVMETGIGGMHLVQELMRGYDALVVLDAVDRGGEAGRLWLLEPELPALDALTERERRDFFADVHYATPVRAMTLARAVGALPPVVRIVGCQPRDADGFGCAMDPAVRAAVPEAVAITLALLGRLASARPC